MYEVDGPSLPAMPFVPPPSRYDKADDLEVFPALLER